MVNKECSCTTYTIEHRRKIYFLQSNFRKNISELLISVIGAFLQELVHAVYSVGFNLTNVKNVQTNINRPRTKKILSRLATKYEAIYKAFQKLQVTIWTKGLNKCMWWSKNFRDRAVFDFSCFCSIFFNVHNLISQYLLWIIIGWLLCKHCWERNLRKQEIPHEVKLSLDSNLNSSSCHWLIAQRRRNRCLICDVWDSFETYILSRKEIINTKLRSNTNWRATLVIYKSAILSDVTICKFDILKHYKNSWFWSTIGYVGYLQLGLVSWRLMPPGLK